MKRTLSFSIKQATLQPRRIRFFFFLSWNLCFNYLEKLLALVFILLFFRKRIKAQTNETTKDSVEALKTRNYAHLSPPRWLPTHLRSQKSLILSFASNYWLFELAIAADGLIWWWKVFQRPSNRIVIPCGAADSLHLSRRHLFEHTRNYKFMFERIYSIE